jgi:uncharacterized protein
MEIAALLGVGLIAGLLAGALGIGGGLVLMPALLTVLAGSVPNDLLVKICLATSLASIPFTGLMATRQQHALANVDWEKVRHLSLGVVVGAILGGLTIAVVSEKFLLGLFCAFVLYAGSQMILAKHPTLPVRFTRFTGATAGLCVGAFSSWVGIGGGTILVPFLLSIGETVRRTVGTSSAVGVVVALAASIGLFASAQINGIDVPGVFGYVHATAVATIVPASLIGAHMGVTLAARLSTSALKRGFGVLLLLTGAKIAVALAI